MAAFPCTQSSPGGGLNKAARKLIIRRQTGLLQECTTGWPRRDKSLLEINCGRGTFAMLLWEWGYDVTVTEPSPELRATAEERCGDRVAVEAASDDHLPFDDESFDWVVLHAIHGERPIEDAIEEAIRVASSGVAVTFWNSLSPACRFSPDRGMFSRNAFGWWRIWKCVNAAGKGRGSSLGTLAGLPCFWTRPAADRLCTLLSPNALAGWCIIRLDLRPSNLVTPLVVRIGRLLRPQQAADGA
ncbi:MAG: class I SAM-dependent methyltransferase [Desulfovibrio sp.]|jgi:hypothetical protein|nr:class I SAM-dependent methyltransferase [Desulfovibrio sp.]